MRRYVSRLTVGFPVTVLPGESATHSHYELRLFYGSGSAAHPVIDAAGAVQQWLSAMVDRIGTLPLVGVLAALALGALALRRGRVSAGTGE